MASSKIERTDASLDDNARTQRQPAVFELSDKAFESGAQRCAIVSNRAVTTEVAGGFERRGVPGFDPIWDF